MISKKLTNRVYDIGLRHTAELVAEYKERKRKKMHATVEELAAGAYTLGVLRALSKKPGKRDKETRE